MSTLTAYVFTPGDPSVGLEGDRVTVTGLPDFDDDEQREQARTALEHAFGVTLGDHVEVVFSDDPPDYDHAVHEVQP